MKKILLLLAAMLTLVSCSDFKQDKLPLHRVTIMYAAAFSNLSTSIAEDIDDICGSGLPTRNSGDVFLVYSHMPTSRGWYNEPSSPVLFRAWADPDGTQHRDTLITYPNTDISSTAEVMNKVLSDVKEIFPAPHYGMIVSSHGKGWIPAGYTENYSFFFSSASAQTKELCIESVEGSGINVCDLAYALPMKFDFIIMDSCLMGCIETAWELKDKCNLLLFSPTEILTDGMMYHTMGPLLTNVVNPDIKRIAKEYYEHYQALSGYYQSASITLMDCTRLEPVAEACRKLVERFRVQIVNTNASDVQAYFYNELHWFFDLRDIFVQAGATEEDLAELDSALEDAIVYTACTDTFFDLKLERVCGVSMYKPYSLLTDLNNFYRGLSWNKAIGLIQ